MDLLCESKFKIGLFGSCYFLGEIIAFIIVPPLADTYGRKLVVGISLAVSIFAQFGLLITHNIYEAYFYYFLLGLTFPGKIIVGYTYLLEFNRAKFQDLIMYILNLSGSLG
jgi:MFS family permease